MSATIHKLYQENDNPFKLSLCAGQSSKRNSVTWVHLLEDESIITYFHGSELAVTTGMKMSMDSSWLMKLVQKLVEASAAGLIINVGKFVIDIPQDVINYCNEREFPLLTMPWEIRITELIQTFCMRIINEQHESTIHDKAMRDAILRRENEEEYREILRKYYDLNGKFVVIQIYVKFANDESQRASSMESLFMNAVRRFKTSHGLRGVRFGLIALDEYELMVIGNMDSVYLPEVRNIILQVYSEAAKAKNIFIGVGVEVKGLENIQKSYIRARTAMRMAMYRNEPLVRFEEMGVYKLLFSIKDEELLYSYADEMLAPLDAYDAKNHNYIDLLKAYIENDRSLEGTASAMFLHRNTINYQIQKMKTMLNCPLKTVEDLLPYQIALMIRDMQLHSQNEK